MLRSQALRRHAPFALVLVLMSAGALLSALAQQVWPVLVELAGIGALVLAWIRWSQQIGREAAQAQILATTSLKLASAMQQHELLSHAAKAVLDAIPGTSECVVYLLDPTGRRLYARYSSDAGTEPSVGIPAAKGIAGRALDRLETVVVNDVDEETELLPLVSGPGRGSLMVAPLHACGHRIGIISIFSHTPGAFSERDRVFFTTLAQPVAMALYQDLAYNSAVGDVQQLEELLDALPCGLLLLDEDNLIMRCNVAAGLLLGWRPTDVVGRDLSTCARSEGARQLALSLAKWPGEASELCSFALELKEPVSAALRVHAASLPAAQGRRLSLVTLLEETDAVDRARQQDALVVGFANELRLALESVRGYATLLMGKALTQTPEQGLWAAQIQQRSAGITRLAEDLARYASHGGHHATSPEPTSVAQLLRTVVVELAGQTRDKGVTLESQCPPNLPLLCIDGDQVRHVLLNLAEFALGRGRPGGHIVLHVEASLDEATFVVADDGVPASAAAQERALRGDWRPGDSESAGLPGMGLGLYVSRKIVEAHGGQLWLAECGASETRFHFMLPLVV